MLETVAWLFPEPSARAAESADPEGFGREAWFSRAGSFPFLSAGRCAGVDVADCGGVSRRLEGTGEDNLAMEACLAC